MRAFARLAPATGRPDETFWRWPEHQPWRAGARVVVHSTCKIFAACFVLPKVSCGWSPAFLPMS